MAGYIFHSLLQMTACTRQVWALCICPHLLHEFDGSMSLVQYLTNASEVAAVMTLLPFQLCIGRTVVMTIGLDFQHGFPISVLW